jgi:Fur family peroxide stress response transcriptional regulator
MSRKTRQKEAILAVLRSTNSHPAADWIYEEVRKDIPNISLGTVYRNLRLLCKSREILELDMCGALARFDARQDNHYHFRCEKCGQVFDVDLPVDDEIDGRLALETGFEVTSHRLEFRGLCRDCHAG